MATADRLGALAADRHRFAEKRVVLTGESAILETVNGRRCLLDSLRLLVRICRNVEVRLPATVSGLAGEVKALADEIAFGRPVQVAIGSGLVDGADAILSVGMTAHADLPWTVINANGWVARVSSGPTGLPSDCRRTNPITALAAASLGVAEVFKRLVAVQPVRGPLANGLEWSLLSFRVGDADPGPKITDLVLPPTLLVGAGAIGNGIIHLLRQLPLGGLLYVVDRQAYGEENLGTCILIGPDQVDQMKVELARSRPGASLCALCYPEELARFKERLSKEFPYPAVVLGAVDDVHTRRQLQDLWPDLTLDGAIGDFGCQVSRHAWTEDLACLRCILEDPPGEAAEVVASRVTGLRAERIATARAAEPVTAEDVESAPVEKREHLRHQLGRPICSVVSEGMTRQISAERQRVGFAPSVPFVACLSAAMVVGELVKWLAGWGTVLETRYQLDALTGPAFGDMFPQERRGACVCVSRRHVIEKLRSSR